VLLLLFIDRSLHTRLRPETGTRAMPIHATMSFVFDYAPPAADLFAVPIDGQIYTRIGSPTTVAFEERVASPEGGIGAVATSSRQAAQPIAVLTLSRQGDRVVASQPLCGGPAAQAASLMFGIDETAGLPKSGWLP